MDNLGSLKRSHYSAELVSVELNSDVTVMGWVHKRRDWVD
jgi:aspartyl-tRNA synthetase